MSTNGIFHSINKLREALFDLPRAHAARVAIKQSNFALFRSANYPNSRLFLLKHKPVSGRFLPGTEIDEHWHVEFLPNSGELKISFAILDTDFPDLITTVSFVAFGEPDADGDLEVYAVDEKTNIVAPNGLSPCWMIFCRKINEVRYSALDG